MVYKGLCYKVTLTLDFTWDFLTIQLLLLCIILLNHARPGFSLNYHNGYTNASQDPSNVVCWGRPRNLCEIDELFPTLTRLRLDLLEKDLTDMFKISQQEVSQIFATWIDRLCCLGNLSFITDHESKKNIFQSALNQTMKMFIPREAPSHKVYNLVAREVRVYHTSIARPVWFSLG